MRNKQMELFAIIGCLLAAFNCCGAVAGDIDVGDWHTAGVCFGKGPASRLELDWLKLYAEPVPTSGLLTSPKFSITEPYINLHVRKGEKLHGTAQLVLVDTGTTRRDNVIRTSPRPATQTSDWFTWDVRDYVGTSAYIQLYDISSADSVNLEKVVLSDKPMQDLTWLSEVRPTIDAVNANRERIAQDPYRPVYHMGAPCGRSWDMNGCVYKEGYCHNIYLTVPTGLPACMSHLRSRDLVHWEQLPPAIWASTAIGEADIYSGDAIIGPDNKGYIFYTSVGIDRTPVFTARIGLAVSQDSDLISWTKEDQPIVTPLSIPVETRHMRDPFVFQERGKYYLVLTGEILKDRYKMAFSNTPNWPAEVTTGAFFLFSSDNLRQWTYVGMPLTAQDVELWNGPLWEMGMLIKFGDKWLFTAGGKAYYTGKMDLQKGKFLPQRQGTITCGTFYAARRMLDPQGRCIVWAPEHCGFTGPEHVRGFSGWESMYSLPRVWTLDQDGRLVQTVASEIEALRGKHTSRKNMPVDSLSTIDDAAGNTIEISADLEIGTAKTCGLELRRSLDGSTGMRVSFDGSSVFVESIGQDMLIGPEKKAEWWATKIHVPVNRPCDGKARLHIFLDKGLMEMFVNDDVTFERPIEHIPLGYTGVAVYSQGGTANLRSLDVWQENPISVKYAPLQVPGA